MKQKTEKIAVLFIVSIMALAGISTSYALWHEDLIIDGTAETGELDWKFTNVGNLDPGPPPISVPDYHCNPGFEGYIYWRGDKDIGYTTTTVTADVHVAEITLNNVYPCYFNMITLYMQATGTIPLRIQSVTFSSDFEEIVIEQGEPIFNLDLDGDAYPDIEFWWRDRIIFGCELYPGNVLSEISFWLHVMQDAPQSAAGLSFTITITAVQYNEYQLP